jgi:hypothetical protein
MARLQDRQPWTTKIKEVLTGDYHFTVLSETETDERTTLHLRGPGGNEFRIDIVSLESDE